MASKVDELKSKFKSFVQKQQNKSLKVPSMGFTDYSNWPGGGSGEPAPSSSVLLASPLKQRVQPGGDVSDAPPAECSRVPDQEILESIEDIYFSQADEPGVDLYELQKLSVAHPEALESGQVEAVMRQLKTQHKVVSKKVMQMILEQRGHCNLEFQRIGETGHLLAESLWLARKSRSYLSLAKTQLTTSNLEILATYKRRQVLQDLLKTLNKIKEIKATDERLQLMLADGKDLPGAITLLLACRATAAEMSEYQCIESLAQKLQDTQMMTEVQLDRLLSDMVTEFDAKQYGQLQEAFRLLDKSQVAVDQLHIGFISQIHSTAFHVLLANDNDCNASGDNRVTAEADSSRQKPLFEQLCQEVPADKYMARLVQLCKRFWRILSCHHQIAMWHQHQHVEGDDAAKEDYIRDKLRGGQTRVWSDVQNKVCTYLDSPAVHRLKFEQFIQVLSVVMRLKKVGQEFCGDASQKLLETVRRQSEAYFLRYHGQCLDEIGLFLDNEAWEGIDSFGGFGQLQEFRSVKKALRRSGMGGEDGGSGSEGRSVKASSLATLTVNQREENSTSSVNSQDGASSIYVFCGYFMRYSDKSSPFDGGFDETMLQEDILAGIADETSCYFSDDEEEEEDEDDRQVVEGANDSPRRGKAKVDLVANNTMLTVLRCIGRYLQMCRLMHVIAPQIVKSLTELVDFYVYAVHELFAKDLPFSAANSNIYPPSVLGKLQRIFEEILPKVSHWPTSRAMVDGDLNSAEGLFACRKRVVAVEGAVCLLEQMERLKGYMVTLLGGDADWLESYCTQAMRFVQDLRKPVYLCVAARFIDIPVVLQGMAKVKWDLNHVSVQYSPYVDTVNRIVQTFAMRFGELWKEGGLADVVREQFWDNVAHVVTHVLVEGYALAKNCSTGGRALMQIDFTHILSFMELLSGYKFGGHQVYVDQFVKAYYLPKAALRDWLQEQVSGRNEYSQRQLTGLVMCTCSSDKKIRQNLLAMLEASGGGGGGGSPVKRVAEP